MWQGILQLLGVIEPNARCTARTSSVLLDLWMNEWTLGNWLAVKTREEMHQQMYHGMEKPCELQEFQFRHCFCKLICMISCIRSIFLNYSYSTSPKLWLENQTLATSLKSPSCIHFWSQQKRDVTWKPRIVASRVKPGRGIQGHALWELLKFTLSQMPQDMFYCISSGNCFSSFLYSYCNRYAITFVGPDLWAYRLATPLGSMKYLGNFLSSPRNQESAI